MSVTDSVKLGYEICLEVWGNAISPPKSMEWTLTPFSFSVCDVLSLTAVAEASV